jgi:hypothetical protein
VWRASGRARCGKSCYRNYQRAHHEKVLAERREETAIRVYFHKECGSFHITSTPMQDNDMHWRRSAGR